jgi:predicted ATPase
MDHNREGSLATLLRQVLVNIEALDAIDFAKWAKRTHRNEVDYSKVDRRMRRFEWAFAYMFPNKKFKEIKNDSNGKQILFEEDGRVTDINQLSSGEKQIVFRGGYVLQNLKNFQNSIFLMDEPEISLHPNWQLKIVDFYKRIFSDGEGQQTAQIFVTTHSPFILHNYLRKNDRVVIIKRDGKGTVLVNK